VHSTAELAQGGCGAEFNRVPNRMSIYLTLPIESTTSKQISSEKTTTYKAGAIYAFFRQQEKFMKSTTLNRAKFSLIAICLGIASTSASAGATGVLDPLNPCGLVNWQITGAIQSSAYSGTVTPLPGAINATSCAGVYTGNEGPALNPSPNIGYLNDGLLNGQSGLLSPTQFISSGQLLDIQTPGSFIDPGWIKLGQLNGNAGELGYSSITPEGSAAYSLSNVIKYTQTIDSTVGGFWLLEVDKNIVSLLSAAGLSRSTFDHLAFSVKSSTSWAVYDFDFNLINDQSPGSFDLNVPYTLSGTWTMNGDFENQFGTAQDISHISVWARDPLATNQVPLPGTVFLVAIGLLALGAVQKRATKA
jgi:hypothetical protein